MPSARSQRCALIVFALAVTAAVGCGGDDPSTGETTFRPNATITVAAPTPLQPAFDRISSESEELNMHAFYSGSDFHADRIREGEKPDLLAADDPAIAEDLLDDGLVQEPVPFATDELVIAVPEDSKIQSVDDLAGAGVSVAIGQEGLPSGDYARAALAGLPAAEAEAILDNAGEEVTNNNGVVAALDEGKADAGFAYASDVTAAGAAGVKLKAIELPPDLRQEVVYVAAVVEDAQNAPGGERFLETLLSEPGVKALERAGLGPPPG